MLTRHLFVTAYRYPVPRSAVTYSCRGRTWFQRFATRAKPTSHDGPTRTSISFTDEPHTTRPWTAVDKRQTTDRVASGGANARAGSKVTVARGCVDDGTAARSKAIYDWEIFHNKICISLQLQRRRRPLEWSMLSRYQRHGTLCVYSIKVI